MDSTKKNFLIFIFCIISNCSYSAYNQIVVGSYFLNDKGKMPLLLVSDDNPTRLWKFIDPNLLNIYAGSLADINCTSSSCVAVGNYAATKDSPDTPLLLATQDHGETWAVSNNIIGVPVNVYLSSVYTIHCADKFCLVGGASKGKNSTPFLLLSRNETGKSWSFINNIIDLPQNINYSEISHIDCSAEKCVAMGSYQLNGSLAEHFLFLASNDAGKNWTFVKKIMNYPANYLFSTMQSLHCWQNNCLLVGEYNNDKAMILKSDDNGNSWSFIKKIKLPQDVSSSSNLYTITCSNNICIAAGSYKNSNYKYVPLILISEDNGLTWSSVEKIKDLPTEYSMEPYLHKVYCQNKTCMIVGFYLKGTTQIPMLLTSFDSGFSWGLITQINGYPSDVEKGTLDVIHCNDTLCTAAGTHYLNRIRSPFFLYSADQGKTWTYGNNILDNSQLTNTLVYGMANIE